LIGKTDLLIKSKKKRKKKNHKMEHTTNHLSLLVNKKKH